MDLTNIPDVVEGQKGHFILTTSVHNILPTMAKKIMIDESSKVNFYNNISSRK